MSICPRCGTQMSYVEQYRQWYCHNCRQYQQPAQQYAEPQHPTYGSGAIWYQNFYRVRKKVLTIGNKYWIEDYNERILGFSKQKLFKLKKDIRIYTDKNMQQELFAIKQQQILDIRGTFAVIDSNTNAILGYIKRKALMSMFACDEWDVYDANNQLIGGIHKSKTIGLLRKYLFKLQGVPVAEINQKFKIIGDIWELRCINVPPQFDRRVLLGGLLLMAIIVWERKSSINFLNCTSVTGI